MTRLGIDSTNVPSAASLKTAGVTFAIGYVSHSPWKVWQASRIKDLRAGGIDVVFVFEDAAARALDGLQAGRDDATFAADQVAALGAPVDQPIYFAVDTDTTATLVSEYFRGVAAVLGVKRVGVYGSIKVIGPLLSSGRATYAWQTYAWSGGNLDPRAQLHQYSNSHVIAGSAVDYNHVYAADFGQWMDRTPKPVPPKPPALVPAPKLTVPVSPTNGIEDLMGSFVFVDANEVYDLMQAGVPEAKARVQATTTYSDSTAAIEGLLSFVSANLRDMGIIQAQLAGLTKLLSAKS